VEEQAADKLVGGERHDLLPSGAGLAVVLVAEGDPGLVEAKEAAARYGDAVGVAREVVERGEVARIESINSFVLTSGPADAIAICDQCKRAIPVAAQAPTRAIADLIGETGFSVSHLVIEAHGRCGRCARGILE
jgi:hypothetical protein